MRNRFVDWKHPDFDERGMTKWNWMCQYEENLELGDKVDIGAFTYINARYGVEIQDGVEIGSHCSIYSDSTIGNKRGKVTIKKNAKIGTHGIVMPGVTIGEGSTVGAASFVNRDVPDNVVVLGVPAKIVKAITPRGRPLTKFETKILSTKDRIQWRELLERSNLKDPSFLPEFLQVYEEATEGESRTHFGGQGLLFVYGDSDNYILYPFFKRSMAELSFSDDSVSNLFDIVSPYGYGGPLAHTKDESVADELWTGFFDKFDDFCKQSKIVSEFCRLHPIFENHKPVANFSKGTTQKLGRVVYVDLSCSEDEIIRGISNRHRREAVKALKNQDLSFSLDVEENHAHSFFNLYTETMQRNKADKKYFYSQPFFSGMFHTLGEHLRFPHVTYQGEIISGALLLRYGDLVHAYWLGSKSDYFHLYPNNLLLYLSLLESKKEGARYFILGGGLSLQEDSMFAFKAGFSRSFKDFYVHKKIHLKDEYDKLVQLRGKYGGEIPEDFFPQYRLPQKGGIRKQPSEIYQKYARYYDLINQDKDYEWECDSLDKVFKKHSRIPVRTLLDAGCGTGGHAIPLTRRGYKVTGIDASEAMLTKAKEKCEQVGLQVDFNLVDLRQFHLSMKFDAAVAMFDVMDYFTTDDDLQKVLRNIRGVLKDNALFAFDFWNGLAISKMFREVSLKEVLEKRERIIRRIHRELDTNHHLCRNLHHFMVIQEGKIIDEMEETHVVRYLFPQEIAQCLEETGFELVEIYPSFSLEEKVDETVWSNIAIARAR